MLAPAFVLGTLVTPGLASNLNAGNGIRPEGLRCEWKTNPLGIEPQSVHMSWTLESMNHRRRGIRQTAYQILVGLSRDKLSKHHSLVWDSGKVLSAEIFQIRYSGRPLSPATQYFWKVRIWDEKDTKSQWSRPAQFTTARGNSSDWKARWIAAEPDMPPQPQAKEGRGTERKSIPPLPIFRHNFLAPKKVKLALAFVSGLGQYELRINGKNATDQILTPGWSNYRRHVFYNTFDVTSLVKPGHNAVGVLLGNGMYNVPGIEGRYTKFIGTFGQPKLIFELHLRYVDGSEAIVASDRSWKTSPGPITLSTIYGGEDYDARREQVGWDSPEFNDAHWQRAIEVKGPGGELTAEPGPAIRVVQSFAAVRVTHPKPGVSVYDLGQNFSGWPEIRVRGSRGDKVKLIGGELLDPAGLVTQHSAGGHPGFENGFSYTLRGTGEEIWHPRFTYYGFRYVQVETAGSDETESEPRPTVISLVGRFIHDDVRTVGHFESSNPLFIQIHRLIDMAILSNMMSVLTDCPHREKLGWLEETHLMGPSVLLNYDAITLYRKMAGDIRDSQLADGMVPTIAPEYVAFVDKNDVNTTFRDSPEWGSAAILSPWIAYQSYGDKDLLASQYETMRSYVAYLASRASGHLLSYGLGDWFDIGPNDPGESQLTSKEVTATAIYYQDLTVISRIAALLDKPVDSRTYAEESGAIKKAFNARLFHPDTGQYDRGSQTANAMPLVLGLVPSGQESRVLENLVADIRKRGNHVSAGDVGFHYVVRALTDAGRSDVLYDILSTTDSPSYAYQLSRGATTLTEAWNANPNTSQNHFMLGHAEEWFYRGLAGISIDLARPREEWISISPAPVRPGSASAAYQSVLGEISSKWTRDKNIFSLAVSIPAGFTAFVRIPTSSVDSVREQGQSLDHVEGLLAHHETKDAVIVVLGSGQYGFTSRL